MIALQSECFNIKVILVFIIINFHLIFGVKIPKCEKENSASKCFYYPNKESTRKEAYESCKYLNSSLLSENDIPTLINSEELGRLWTAYNLNSQEKNENSYTRDIACSQQENQPDKLYCSEENKSQIITMKNRYDPEKTCIAVDFYEELHFFTGCEEKLRYFCIRMKERSTISREILYLDEKSYKNWKLDCESMDIKVGNIQLKLLKTSDKRISKTLEWSLIKQMNMDVKCVRNSNSSMFYKILPMHDLEFIIKSNSSEFNMFSLNNNSNPEYTVILNDFSTLPNINILTFNIKFEENLKSWKISLKSLNEAVLKLASLKVLKKRNYIPLFCVEETSEYGFNNTVNWDFTRGNEFQVPNPNICKTQENDMKKRKCKISESQDGLPEYKWSTFDLKKCNHNGICPPDYEPVVGSKCVKITSAVNFESHFYNFIGIEYNIWNVESQTTNSENIINFIRLKGVKEVLIPLSKLEKFDRIVYISKNSLEEDGIADERSFIKLNRKYFSYYIYTRTISFHDKMKENIPYISIINRKELVELYSSSNLFSKNNPTLKKRSSCYGYFSHYEGKCITIISNGFKSWREALDFCRSKNLELLDIEYDFLEENYKNMIANENIPSVWIGYDSKSLRKKQKVLTPFGRHIIDNNVKLGHTACQTKSTQEVSSFPLTMKLTEKIGDNGKYLCLKFNTENVDFLKKFPICYCYPDWKTQAVKKSTVNTCDYVTEMIYSSECQCTSVILREKSESVIHSNVIKFYNRYFNYFIVYITLSSTKLTMEEIDKSNINDSIIPISNWDDNVCKKSQLQSAYSSQNGTLGKSYVLACPEYVHADDINIKEVERNIIRGNRHLNVSVIVRASDGCYRDKISDGVRNLTWEKTSSEGYFQPTELCLTRHSVPIYRKCEGNYFSGYKWNPFNENCTNDVSDFERNLWKLKVKNATNKLNELQEILFNKSDKVTPYVIYAVSDILSKTDRRGEYSVSTVINIVSNILESPVKNITYVNIASNVSNHLLASFDELLISQVPFNFTTEQEKVNNNDQIVVFSGSISDADNELPVAFGIENKGDGYSISFLETIENENSSQNIIVSIPESLRRKNLKLSYVYKQWKNKLFFEDSSLKEKELEIVGDVIDVNFVDLRSKIKIKNINDNITIKMKANYLYKDKPFVCVSWNIDNGFWSTEGCSTSSTDSKSNYISCTCNHLTHYCFLFYALIEKPHAYALNIIVYLGSSVSIFFLLIIMISGLILKKWPKHEDSEAKTLINLCIAMLGATLCILIGPGYATNKVFCDIFAALLYYFLLSSFFWMSTEAFFKYLIYVRGRSFLDYNLYKRAFLVSWGIPLMIGIILWVSRFLSNHQLQKKESCWLLKTEMFFYFLLPLCLFMTLNMFLFISIIYSFRKMLGSETTPRNSENLKKRYKRVIYEVSVLGFLFCLTWLFGLFLVTENQTTTIIAYVFSILQSLQGTLIFLRIYGNKLFRDEWGYFLKKNTRNFDLRSDAVSATQRSNQG
ncbi:UNVERIFIED_CONTAM: hypothetical protein RMT77_015660 [Armadillidium vulgare]